MELNPEQRQHAHSRSLTSSTVPHTSRSMTDKDGQSMPHGPLASAGLSQHHSSVSMGASSTDDGASARSAADTPRNLPEELGTATKGEEAEARPARHVTEPPETDEVDWDNLQKNEEEAKGQQDDNSTAMLLAMLEQENERLASNPKTAKAQAGNPIVAEPPAARPPRPPSMAQLREMVQAEPPAALRYSMLPPPPMTDLEFYVALARDYQQTAARLPTLLSRKIRKGIPPPLRGVVWQSMAGANDSLLLEQYEHLAGLPTPDGCALGKDVGRSFSAVDMFRDPEGDGQRMLGKVLKCFSLYDPEIGYCQGLALIVGPLLIHMPDNQAFCVLVRLMEKYDLRACFLPGLLGLHVRIDQFRELLQRNLPKLAAHLDELQVDHAYVSQWFLSFFAVTCPLPMLFRIYDVLFAEGAPETLMRVALALMRKNESRILACTEFHSAISVLLSRSLWDCYHYNADEFVDDFVSFSGAVSRETLAPLELSCREAQVAAANAALSTDVVTVASRFLGRQWTKSISGSSSEPADSPPRPNAPSNPASLSRSSASKHSLASTLNSMEAGSVSVLSSASTEATNISSAEDASARESTPTFAKSNPVHHAADRHLHSQIEDLLMALSELQRSHALLTTELQREGEEREADKTAVRLLVDGLRKKTNDELASNDDVAKLIEAVEHRIGTQCDGDSRPSSSVQQTKSQLQEELARTKEHLQVETSKTREFNRRIDELGQEASQLRDQLKESHSHTRMLHQEKQRLEKQINTMRARTSETTGPKADGGGGWFSSSHTNNNPAGNGRLKELKLGRGQPGPSTRMSMANKRSTSLLQREVDQVPAPNNEHEALLLELVKAKTAEAVAREEVDEYKRKLECMRKSNGAASVDATPATSTNSSPPAASAPAPSTATSSASNAATAAMGMFGRLAGSLSEASNAATKGNNATTTTTTTTTTAAAPAAAPSGGGGFWGWRR